MVASVAVGIIPVIVLINLFGVPRKLIVGWGVLSYIVGVTAFKLPLYHLLVVKILHPRLSQGWLSLAHGFVSAVAELGAALLFFVFVVPNLSLVQLIGFGAAAAAVEAVMLPFMRNPLSGTPLEEHASEVIERSSSSTLVAWMSVMERIWAFIPHITSRGLTYISYATGNVVPAILAVATFAAIDGRAYYAHLQKWAFDDLHVLGRLYRYLVWIAVCQTLLFIGFYYLLM